MTEDGLESYLPVQVEITSWLIHPFLGGCQLGVWISWTYNQLSPTEVGAGTEFGTIFGKLEDKQMFCQIIAEKTLFWDDGS